jgi:tripartite-type tricarboxylate transporter receptor subunit TctC
MQRRKVLAAGAATIGLGLACRAMAQQMPGTIALVLPMGGGSGGDTASRQIADIMAKRTRRSVIVENKPGADTLIATQYVLNGPADGSRVLFTSPSNLVINPIINPKLPYNPQTDLIPLITTVRGGTVLVVKPGRHASLEAFIEDARKKPGGIALGTYGGHYYRLIGLMLERELGIQLNHVPYPSPSPALNDVMGGTLDAMLIDASGVAEFHRAGKVKALAVTHEKRPAAFSEVPCFHELGYGELTSYIWIGFAAKAGTPAAIVAELEQALTEAVDAPEFVQYVQATAAGGERVNFNGARTRQYLQEERKRFLRLIQTTGYTG